MERRKVISQCIDKTTNENAHKLISKTGTGKVQERVKHLNQEWKAVKSNTSRKRKQNNRSIVNSGTARQTTLK